MKKKIIFISAGRSDLNRFQDLLETINKSKKTDLYVFLTSVYYNTYFNYDLKNIKKKFKVIKRNLKISNHNDTSDQMVLNLSNDIRDLLIHSKKIKPDLFLIVGDRYEMLVGPMVALPNNIPMIHFFGGSITEGAIDDSIRHSLTKLSHFHYVILETYKKRLKQLGEEKWRIKNIGMPNLIKKNFKFKKLSHLSKEYNFDLSQPYIVLTYHPVTLDLKNLNKEVNIISKAINRTNFNVVLTYPNSDPKFKSIIKILKKEIKNDLLIIKSCSEKNFFSLLKFSNFTLGNSSSGIVEAASLKIPSINIGDRQKGKYMPRNVINVKAKLEEILKGINKTKNKYFKNSIQKIKNPYNSKVSLNLIANQIINFKSYNKLLKKKFVDIKSK